MKLCAKGCCCENWKMDEKIEQKKQEIREWFNLDIGDKQKLFTFSMRLMELEKEIKKYVLFQKWFRLSSHYVWAEKFVERYKNGM